MPVIVVSGPAEVYSRPRKGRRVTDPDVLASLHGVYAQDFCAQFFRNPILESLGMTGGRLRLIYSRNSQSLRITTAFDVLRKPGDDERTAIVAETTAQWSDGAGGGLFANHTRRILSTTIGMALQNAGRSVVGELFVDVHPNPNDEDILVEYLPSGASDDAIIADLLADVEAGNLDAMIDLGRRYQLANGVPADETRAFALFEVAAHQRHPFAMTLLGDCYESGKGCQHDREKAMYWFKQGVEFDYPLAMHCLGEMYAAENPEESVALYRRGAELGDLGCLAQLGDSYEFGKGVPRDIGEALACYRRCLTLGFDVSEAIERIEAMKSS